MCCNNRRAARAERSYGRRNQPEPAADITSLIGAIQEVKLASHGIDSRAQLGHRTMPPAHTAELDAQTRGIERGIAYDDPSAADEEKEAQAQRGMVDFEELPSYEDSTGASSKPSILRDLQPEYTPTTSKAPFAYTKQSRLPGSNTEAAVLSNLEVFRTSLLSYSQGARHARKDARHAAKTLVKDLHAQEIARVRSERGYLECGERKQVKRELKPVKDMLKGAVWEAKRERKGRY